MKEKADKEEYPETFEELEVNRHANTQLVDAFYLLAATKAKLPSIHAHRQHFLVPSWMLLVHHINQLIV